MNREVGELYSVAGLVALYALEPELRDVFVEGRTDAAVLGWYLAGFGGHDGGIFPVDDRVAVPAELVLSYGFEVGAKGRVLALAVEIERSLGPAQLSATFVVDADQMHLVGPFPRLQAALLVTDGGSLDCYFLQERPLGKFVKLVAPQNAGNPAELLTTLLRLLKELQAVRVALHFFQVSCLDNPYALCGNDSTRSLVERREILSRSLGRLAKSDQPCDLDLLDAIATELVDGNVSSDWRFARGHDIAPLLIRVLALRSPLNSAAIVEVLMRLSLERGDLDDKPMFMALRSRVLSRGSA